MAKISWNSPADGSWSGKANWTPAREPGSKDVAYIDPANPGGASYTITDGTNDEVSRLQILDSHATLQISNNTYLSVLDGGSNKGTIDVVGGDESGGQLTIDGTFNNYKGIIDLESDGASGTLGGTIDGGTLDVGFGDTFGTDDTIGAIQHAAITDEGDLVATGGPLTLLDDRITGGGIISAFGPEPDAVTLTIVALPPIVYLDGTTVVGGTFEDSGTGASIETVADTTSNVKGGTTIAFGTVGVTDGSTLTVTGPLDNGAILTLNSTGDETTLQLDGTVKLTGDGAVYLSDSAANQITGGTLTNDGNFISGAGEISSALTNLAGSHIDASGDNALVIDPPSPLLAGAGAPALGTVTNSGALEADGAGGLQVDANVKNAQGLIFANGGNVTVEGSVSFGDLDITGATASIGSSDHVDTSFTENTGTLALVSSAGFTGTVAGLGNGGAGGNMIDLEDLSFGGLTTEKFKENAAGTQGTLTLGTGSQTDTITLLGQFMNAFTTGAPASTYTGFVLNQDSGTGTLVSYVTGSSSVSAAHSA
jgi:hypothetical protein